MLSVAGRSRAQTLTLLLRSSAIQIRQLGSRPQNDPEVLGSQLAESFHKDPEGTVSALTAALDQESRHHLLIALFPTADSSVRDLDDEYVDTVFKQADFKDGDGLLDRSALELLFRKYLHALWRSKASCVGAGTASRCQT